MPSASQSEARVLGGIEPAGSPAIGQDIGLLAGVGALGVKVSSDALALIAEADAILDFTRPAATVEFAGLAANARIVHIIGTTGSSPGTRRRSRPPRVMPRSSRPAT